MWFAMALAATAAGFSSVGGTAAWAFASPAFTALLLLKVMRIMKDNNVVKLSDNFLFLENHLDSTYV
jgi:hypothetical protein